MIYGDNPQRINERQDPLGLNVYTLVPDRYAIMQAGNLYAYCMGNLIMFVDPTGEIGFFAAIGGAVAAVVSSPVALFVVAAVVVVTAYAIATDPVFQQGLTQSGQNLYNSVSNITVSSTTASKTKTLQNVITRTPPLQERPYQFAYVVY